MLQETNILSKEHPFLSGKGMGVRLPIIKQVPPERVGGKILFVGTDGRFYNAKGRELKPHFNQAMQRRKKGDYPCMSNFCNRLCHHLVYETFVGPRTKGMEIDHINGNKLDWSLDNLQEVTPAENRKRARILRIMRRCAEMDNDPSLLPVNRSRAELLSIFATYDFMKGDKL